MISELNFDPKFRPAMMTVFGTTLVCRDSEKAAEFSKSARMDCITMEGRSALSLSFSLSRCVLVSMCGCFMLQVTL